MMNEELVKELRNMFRAYKATDNENCRHAKTILKAADAIEELWKKYLASEVDATNLTGWLAEEHAKNLWIPVTERLPNEKQAEAVLCWITDRDPKAEGYCVSGYYNTLTKSWLLDADWVDPWKITHWMPLPEPPKEEGEDDDLMEVEHDSN